MKLPPLDNKMRLPDRKRLFEIVEVGAIDDAASRYYDFVGVFFVLLNLTLAILQTFDGITERWGVWLSVLEALTVVYFVVDYILRIIVAKYKHPDLPESQAVLKYLFSLMGMVDLFSFLPYFLPFVFPTGVVAFRMFRIIRIFRLFRINAYYDSLNVITEVLKSKKQQLLSSMFLLWVLMIASSLVMYSLEHEAQPDVFTNAFSGIWWAVSTLLTVGYGDIYPVTTMGKFFSIIITFLGVMMVAIPTGIISAGFVDQYSRVKRLAEIGEESGIRFLKIHLTDRDSWTGQSIRELQLPGKTIIAAVRRGRDALVPRGNVILMPDDTVILGAEPYMDDQEIEMRELVLGPHNPWNGTAIRDLDISRQTIVVMVRRGNKTMIPSADMVLREGDKLILYSKNRISGSTEITI